MFVGGVPVFQNTVLLTLLFVTYKSDLVSLRATLKSSFSIAQRSFTISTIIPSTIETGSRNCKKYKSVELGRVILSDTRCHYNLFSRTTVKKKKKTVLLFALPIAWVSIILAG